MRFGLASPTLPYTIGLGMLVLWGCAGTASPPDAGRAAGGAGGGFGQAGSSGRAGAAAGSAGPEGGAQGETAGSSGRGGADAGLEAGSAAGGLAGGGASSGSGKGGAAGGGAGNGGEGVEPPRAAAPLVNGVTWADTTGAPIQAHGGGVLRVGDEFYWFGENRNADGTFFAVSVYRSPDLVRWEKAGDALTSTSAAELRPANIERPKVVYNESTDKYVMWMHWENGSSYAEARAAVASADSVNGPYTYHGSLRPLAGSGIVDHEKPGYMSRDCSLFVDDDGAGYFISASNENYDLHLYRLTPDYLALDELVAVLFPGGHREAPALFKRNGVYFLLTSGATGWSPNQARYATSRSLASGWSALANVGDATTFDSQPAFVLQLKGETESSFLYLGDRWAGAWGGRVNDSSYVWQPLSFPTETTMSMSWHNTLGFDVAAGRISGALNGFRFVNVKSGKALDVAGGATQNGARVVQSVERSDGAQVWDLEYDGAGGFKIRNVATKKLLEVLEESSGEGAPLSQWEGNGGAHQAWLVLDVGAGRYQLKNKKSGKVASVAEAAAADGAAIEQRTTTGGEEQMFRLLVVP
jgi:Glycosyl hydrolases family 43/Ricin-type beta-trefoil lectin domain-like